MAYQQHPHYQQPTQPMSEHSPQHQQANLHHQPSIHHQHSVRYPQQPSSVHRQDSVSHPTWQSTSSSHPDTMSSMSSPGPKTPMSEFGGTWSEYPRTPRSHTGLYPRRPPPEEKKRIWGMKRQAFYIILAITLFLLVVATAAGLGVGLALTKNLTGSSSDADSAPANNSTTTTSTPTKPTISKSSNAVFTTTGTIPVAKPTASLVTPPIICPEANNTNYISTYNKLFEVQCGRDYAKKDGAIDLESTENVPSFAACLDLCATTVDCIGAGYGKINGIWTCFPKSHLGNPGFTKEWNFATYQEPPS